MKSARRSATYDDLRRVPEHMVAEIIEGELVTTPRPASPHARALTAITSDLFGNFDGPPGNDDRPSGWWILAEPELHFESDVLVPDVAGWRRARMPSLPNLVGFTQMPDWVCEVLSPSTTKLVRTRKMAIYARMSVEYVWLVEPIAREIEVYRLDGRKLAHVATHAGDAAVRAEPFDAVTLDVRRWWMER